MIYIFDIDGTLADCMHRLHFIEKEPKDWDGFFEACVEDQPIRPIIRIARLLTDNDASVLLLTGRSERVRDQTKLWLRKQGIEYQGLYMRRDGDHRPDTIVKTELLLNKVAEHWNLDNVYGIFEDRSSVVRKFRSMGYTVFQVADGDF